MLAVRFFLTPFILHRLGDTYYGLFVLVGSVIGHGALIDLGIRSAVTRYVAGDHASGNYQRAHGLVATSLWLYCALGMLVVLLAAAIAPFFSDIFNVPPAERTTTTILVLLTAVQIAVSIPAAIGGSVLWGLQRYGLANMLLTIETLVSAIVTVAVLLAGGGVVAMVAAGIPVVLAMQIATVWCINRVAPELSFGWRGARRDLVRTVLSFGGPIFVIEIAQSLRMRVDEIAIGASLPVSSVSPYSVARRLGRLPELIGQLCLAGFIPTAAQFHAEGSVDRLQSLYVVGSRVTLAASIPLAMVLFVLAGPLLTLWVGAQYAEYAPIVMVLALASLAEISHWPGGAMLRAIDRHRGLAVASICAMVANFGLAVALVRPFGLIGVAVGTLVPGVILNICYVWPYTARVTGIPLRRLLRQAAVPALGPALPMVAVLYAVQEMVRPAGVLPVGLIATAGLATYALVYFACCAGDHERQLLRSVAYKLTGVAALRPNMP